MSHRIEPLADGHDLDTFTCGHPDLDQWLHLHARQATRQGTRTYLLIEGSSNAVAGYFAIAPHTLARDEAPPRIGRGAPRAIPAILLAKLALDRRFQGQGLGDELLVHALDFQPTGGDPHRLAMKLSTAARELGLPWP